MKSQIATSKPAPPKDLWEQMDAITGAPLEDAEGISAEEYATRHKKCVSQSRLILNKLADQGKLIVGYKRHPKSGARVKVFRPA